MELTVLVFTYVCLKELPLATGLILPDDKQFPLTGSSNLNKLTVDFHDTDPRQVDINERSPFSETNRNVLQSHNREFSPGNTFAPKEKDAKGDVVGNSGFGRPFPELFLPRRNGQKLVSILTPPKPLEPHHVLLKEVYKLARNIHKNVTRDKADAAQSTDQILLEPSNNIGSEKLEGMETGSKMAETEVSRGIAMFAAIFCQRCNDKGDTECMKRHCLGE